MYIQGSAIDEKFKGSMEYQISLIHSAINEHLDYPVRILSTKDDHAYAVDDSGQILKISYKIADDKVENINADISSDIPVIEDQNICKFVSDNLKSLAEDAMSGKQISRTQVRDLMQLLDREESYWLSDILNKIEESYDNSNWFSMYEANQEKIRTSMYGQIRSIESPFPNTRFSQIASSKLSNFDSELHESLNIICKLMTDIIDECKNMVFDQDNDGFFGAICESLIVEAQTIGGLVGKADKLMRIEDMGRIAEAHDKLADRAKTMAVVSAYLKKRTQQKEE
jgi:hypothetical protein